MELKVLLGGNGARTRRVQVTCEPDATVGAVAEAINRCDPEPHARPSDGVLTLSVGDGSGTRSLHAQTPAGESGLRSGALVSVAPAPSDAVGSSAAVAVLRVLSGPEAGLEFPLLPGASYIGRGRTCEVRLSDPRVSKAHARVIIGDTIEIVDQNSSNGVEMGGQIVGRAVVTSDDQITIGDTVVSISPLRAPAVAQASGYEVPFNRPPRLAPDYVGERLVSPEPPAPPQRGRFPVIPLIIPLLMGGVLYLMTQNAASIVFVAMSPILMIGMAVESAVAGRRLFTKQTEQFRGELAELEGRLDAAVAAERAGRALEQPSTAEFVDSARALSDLLWCRRPEHDTFLRLRLGLGTQPARVEVEPPNDRNGDRALRAELDAVVGRFAAIDQVPVVADLRDVGALGLAGTGDRAAGVARSAVLQLVLAHSPGDLVIASVAAAGSAADWDWLTWLPHVASAERLLGVAALGSTEPTATTVVGAIAELVTARLAQQSADVPGLPAVVLVVCDDAPVSRPALVDLVERGPQAGVHVVWVAPSPSRLPAGCRAFVASDGLGGDRAGFVRTGLAVDPLVTESLDRAAVDSVARRLAPVTDSGVTRDDVSGIPASVSFLSIAGVGLVGSPDEVVERWRESGSLPPVDGAPARRRREGTLRALVGATATEPLHLDLRVQGPHALVGGTTGSGKSEFLQSWVLGMATAHSPSRVTFLLVDYKGGSAFADCVRLPHTVGLVTDLSPHLVRRALISLNAELRYREHVLNRKGVKDLVELERTGDPETPPSLVIVVDEFAALVQEVPEFVDGVVNVAQRGRSLGLHLILATQRPAGVIKDNLRANTNLRVALRMADESDSTDVVGDAIAGGFDPSIPGRAVAKTGPGRLTVFQAAYAGGRTSGDAPPARVSVGSLDFGPVIPWPEPDDDQYRPPQDAGVRSDIQRMVDTVADASRLAGLPAPRKPWLAELARVYDLAALPTKRLDTELVFGVQDDPDAQAQPVAAYFPDRDGSIAVYGTGGSGKTAFLRAIAIAAGLTARGGPCVVHGLDFAGRGLSPLEMLPHVGSIISGDDDERVVRLIRWLRELIDERAARYAAVNAGTITQYRELAARPDESRVIVLVDGLGAFRQAYETGMRGKWFDMLQAIASDGRQVGVHVIVSADRPGAVPSSLASALQRRLVLRLSNENDEAMLSVPRDVLSADTPAGRGFLDGSDVQVAVLGKDPSTPGQAAAIARLAESMRKAGVPEAEPIRRLPELVGLADLPSAAGGLPTLGLADESLGAIGFPDTGVFLVAGPPRSGRTTALATMVASLRRTRPGIRLVYLGNRRSPLRTSVAWDAAADTVDDVADLSGQLAAQLAEQSGAGTSGPALAVVIEGVPDFLNTAADMVLQDLVKACRSLDHLVLCDGETSALTGSWPLLQAVKATRCGLALQPDQVDGDTVFRTPFPRVARGDFPPGRGLLVHGGRSATVQVAVPEDVGSTGDRLNKEE